MLRAAAILASLWICAGKAAAQEPSPAKDTCQDGMAVSVAAGKKFCVKPGSGESFKDCPECPEMVAVPAGTFIMGSPESEPGREPRLKGSERPRHSVTFGRPFAVGQFSITVGEYMACVKDGGCRPPEWDEPGSQYNIKTGSNDLYRSLGDALTGDRYPIFGVSWDDAKAYAAWLSNKTGKEYRLLSEAEREYVTRAGTEWPFWWGSSISTTQANYNGNYTYDGSAKGEFRKTALPVKSFSPNPWGLYQVHGNVWEWTEDCWHKNYLLAPSDGSAWTGEDCSRRVVRGGDFTNDPGVLRAAARINLYPGDRYDGVGFRLARILYESFKDCPECPEMVVIPAGNFTMGSPESDGREKPPHGVTFAKPFAVGRFSITVGEYMACVAGGGCKPPEWDGPGSQYNVKTGLSDLYTRFGDALTGDRYPIVGVSWQDAKAYAAWLSNKTGKEYRLLSEAEREYVTRAGTTRPYWWGSSISATQANYDGSATVLVKSFEPNPWGLYQVHGNVWEWTEDCWNADYRNAPSDGSAWTAGDCAYRVLRGGSWDDYPQDLRAARRLCYTPDNRNNNIGFRVAAGWQDLSR